jgi:hypothetical protein
MMIEELKSKLLELLYKQADLRYLKMMAVLNTKQDDHVQGYFLKMGIAALNVDIKRLQSAIKRIQVCGL